MHKDPDLDPQGREGGHVTVTICPLPSLRMTTSQSNVSLASRHWTSVGSNGFILTCNDPLSTTKQRGVIGPDLSFLHKRSAQNDVEMVFFREEDCMGG